MPVGLNVKGSGRNDGDKPRSLGCYKTVFEAALTYARYLGPEGCAEHMAAVESAAANAKRREEAKEQAERRRDEHARDARAAREAERVAAVVARRTAKKLAREELSVKGPGCAFGK